MAPASAVEDLPLVGVTVADLSVTLPGPFCTQVLRRLGATVVQLEPPGGDPLRAFAPDCFGWLSAGKRSVVVDLKRTEDRATALDVLRSSDVVVEGWRPGVADRLGLGYAQVAAAHPAVIYCSVSGYGAHGPLAGVAGHDINYVAEAGALALTSTAGLPVADLAGGAAAATRILAHLVGTQRTGKGRHLDVSLTGAVVDWLDAIGGAAYRDFARVYQSAHYGAFSTKDDHVLTIGVAQEQPLWANLITALGRGEWADLDITARVERRDELLAYVRARVSALTSDEIDGLLSGVDTCWAWARVPGSPVRVSGALPDCGGAVPGLDEHGDLYRPDCVG